MTKATLLGILLALLMLPAWAGGQSKASQAALGKEAKITMEQAQKAALAKEPGKIQEGELEREKGRVIYSFDIKMADVIREVNIDAMTGEVVEDTVESSAAEAKERRTRNKRRAKRARHQTSAATARKLLAVDPRLPMQSRASPPGLTGETPVAPPYDSSRGRGNYSRAHTDLVCV